MFLFFVILYLRRTSCFVKLDCRSVQRPILFSKGKSSRSLGKHVFQKHDSEERKWKGCHAKSTLSRMFSSLLVFFGKLFYRYPRSHQWLPVEIELTVQNCLDRYLPPVVCSEVQRNAKVIWNKIRDPFSAILLSSISNGNFVTSIS